jgi:hypothetical protein
MQVLELLSKDPNVTRCSPVPVDARHSNEVFGGRRKSTSPLLNFADLRQLDAHAFSGRGKVHISFQQSNIVNITAPQK